MQMIRFLELCRWPLLSVIMQGTWCLLPLLMTTMWCRKGRILDSGIVATVLLRVLLWMCGDRWFLLLIVTTGSLL